MVSDEIQQLRVKMDGLVREQADRRALLDRQGEEIKAKSQEYMTKQAQAAEKYLEHRRELGKREREAGGWATEKSMAEKNTVMGFRTEDEEEQYASRSTESMPSRRPEPQQAAPIPPSPETTDRTPSPETTDRTPSPSAPPARPERRGRHSREENFDEDDFSNNSWLN